jgi:hypothetical protein
VTSPEPNAFISAGQIVTQDSQHKDTRRRISEKLSWALQTRNIAILVGAGASYHLSPLRIRKITIEQIGVLGSQFGESFTDSDLDILARVSGEPKESVDIERLLADLSTAIRFANSPYARGELQHDASSLIQVRAKLNHTLTLACDLPKGDDIADLKAHCVFLSRLLASRRGDLPRIKLFTTNYDLAIEKALDVLGVDYVDGFIGTVNRTLRLDVYSREIYVSAAVTGERRPRRLADFLYLYKIHGSINWRTRTQNGVSERVVQVANYMGTPASDLALIYPTPQKEVDTLGYPYSDLLRAFGSVISEPDTVLVAIGYGYADDHINRIIAQALASNATLAVVNVDPYGLIEKYGDEYRLSSKTPAARFISQIDARISGITGPDCKFERFAETYLPALEADERPAAAADK